MCMCGMCVCVCGGGGGKGATQMFKDYILSAIQHTCHKKLLSKIRERHSIDTAMVAHDVCCVHAASRG